MAILINMILEGKLFLTSTCVFVHMLGEHSTSAYVLKDSYEMDNTKYPNVLQKS